MFVTFESADTNFWRSVS